MRNLSLHELLDQVDLEPQVTEVSSKEIAIVGMALQFPEAEDVRRYWQNLTAGRDCVSRISPRRKRDVEAYVHRCLRQDHLEVKVEETGYLKEIDRFDYAFFGLSPKEASLMDPAHRLFLQCAWQAIEDAGYSDGSLAGTETGLYLGYSASELYDYKRLIGELEPRSAPLAAAGNIISMMASRIAYFMDLRGPSIMIDTACSSSLVAVHEACKAIRNGDCRMAIAGGIRLTLVPIEREEKLGIESSDHRTRAFDEYADGSTMSEGVAAIVMKPLAQAKSDGDMIYAVIKGSAVNQDGRSNGITAPNPEAQAAVLEKAWKAAGVHPESLSYIETHGTGTKLGDPIEMEGLMQAFRKYTDKKQYCAIGSAKSSLGHLDSAAGIAGLIKAVLSLRHEQLPPSLYFRRPNRKIRFHRSPFYVNTRLAPWKRGEEPRRCGVSSFGISGTNCHVVLEEAPIASAAALDNFGEEGSAGWRLFTISAKSHHSLVKLVERYADWLGSDTSPMLGDICYSTCVGRAHHEYRLAIVADSIHALKEKLGYAFAALLDSRMEPMEQRAIWYGRVGNGHVGGDVLPSQAEQEVDHLLRAGEWGEVELRLLAKHYVNGAQAAWGRLYAGERRSRVPLPPYPFLRHRCWLDIPAKQLYSDFFADEQQIFVPEWIQTDDGQSHENSPAESGSTCIEHTVIFMDKAGMAKRFMAAMAAEGKTNEAWIEVELGDAFCKLEEYRYAVGPTEQDYLKLIEAIRVCDVGAIVHFGAIRETSGSHLEDDPQDRLESGLYSCFYLVTALRASGWKHPLQITIVAPWAYRAEDGQATVIPESAALFGYGKVIAYELPGSRCRCIDWDLNESMQPLLEEWKRESNEYVCALRGDARYVQRLRMLEQEQVPQEPLEVHENGTYLITGGIGIVGLQMARVIAATRPVRIVLVNRSVFPDRSEWAKIRYEYEMNEREETTYKRIQLIEQIESNGSELIVMSADVTDEAAMRSVLHDVRLAYGPIRGIVHAAGIVHPYDFDQVPLTIGDVRDDLRPKVDGTRVLDRLTAQDPLDFFLLCSSIITLTGGNLVGGYAASNTFLDAFTEERNLRGKRTVAVNWSTWEETFYTSILATDNPAYTKLFGQYSLYKVMPDEHVQAYMAQALALGLPRVIVGQVNADGEIFDMLDTLAVRYADETVERLRSRRLAFDRERLVKEESSATAHAAELKGRENDLYTEVEKRTAAVWSSVLGYPSLDVNDNFYELGGDSIAMMKMISLLTDQFGVHMKPTVFMDHLTIERMAEWITGAGGDEAKHAASDELARTMHIEPDSENRSVPFALTEVQRAYFMGRHEYFEMGGISTHAYSELTTKLDIDRLAASLNAVIRRHPMLRCIILPSGKQKILERVPAYPIEVEDLRALKEPERQARIERERGRMSHQMFQTDRWPLFEVKAFRIGEDEHYLCTSFDVLIADGMSMQLVEKDVMQAYTDPDRELEPLAFTFRDYIQAYEAFRKTKAYEESREFWLGRVHTFPDPPNVPTIRLPSDIAKPTFQRMSMALETAAWRRIKEVAAQHSVTPSAVFCTAYVEVLSRWSNQPQLAVNLTVFNRYPFHPDVHEMVGDFTSLMLLGLDWTAHAGFWDKAAYVHRTIAEALEHRHYDGTEMIRELARARKHGNGAMMPYVFTSLLSQDFQGAGEAGTLPGEAKMRLSQTSQVFLDFQLTERAGVVELSWDYVTELFDTDMIGHMFAAFRRIVEQLTAQGDPQPIPLPPSQEELYLRYNDTLRPHLQATTLDRMFVERALRHPERIAVIDRQKQVTYGELYALSQRFAAYLQHEGVKPGEAVGVVGHRHFATIAAMQGVLMLGACYVPIDPDYPEERQTYILSHSACRCLVDAIALESTLQQLEPGEERLSFSHPDAVAYIIYTSGSTGQPKGVVVTHGAAANTLQDIGERFGITEEDRVGAISSFSFDLSVFDWFGTLAAGAAVIVIDDPRDMPSVLRAAAAGGLTVWNSVPALLSAMLELLPPDGQLLPELRTIMLSGDWIPLQLARKARQRFPHAALYSLGGATEAAIWSIYYPIENVDDRWRSIPYGYPLGNQRWYVLSEDGHICPAGVTGELVISGAGLAREYWRDNQRTQLAFIEHPGLGRLYRTGDYGVMHPEGYIEFLGRRDHQIKIRGYRVELGEIESILMQQPEVRDAVVVDKQDQEGRTYLAAYLVPSEAWHAAGEQAAEQVMEALRARVPVYMIPSRLAVLEELPLSANGKVDRKQLPEPEERHAGNSSAARPATQMEKTVFGIWEDVLGTHRFGIRDHFFDAGGDSIMLMRVHAKIEHIYPGLTHIADLFAYPTVEALSAELARRTQLQPYQHASTLLPRATIRAIEESAAGLAAEPFELYVLAFVYLVAERNAQTSVRLAALDGDASTLHHLLLEEIESASEGILKLKQQMGNTDKVAAQAGEWSVVLSRFAPRAEERDFDIALSVRAEGEVQAAFASSEVEDEAKRLATRLGDMIAILAEQL